MDLTKLLEPFNGMLAIYWLYLVGSFMWSSYSIVNSPKYRMAIALGDKFQVKASFLAHGIWAIPLILAYRLQG